MLKEVTRSLQTSPRNGEKPFRRLLQMVSFSSHGNNGQVSQPSPHGQEGTCGFMPGKDTIILIYDLIFIYCGPGWDKFIYLLWSRQGYSRGGVVQVLSTATTRWTASSPRIRGTCWTSSTSWRRAWRRRSSVSYSYIGLSWR